MDRCVECWLFLFAKLLSQDEDIPFWSVRPLNVLADIIHRFGGRLEYGPGVTVRSQAIWNSAGAKEIHNFFSVPISKGTCWKCFFD